LAVVAGFVELAVDSFEVLVFLVVWPAKMLGVMTLNANTVVNIRKKTPVCDTLMRFSFRAASFDTNLV
jgi:hypothetical protein